MSAQARTKQTHRRGTGYPLGHLIIVGSSNEDGERAEDGTVGQEGGTSESNEQDLFGT